MRKGPHLCNWLLPNSCQATHYIVARAAKRCQDSPQQLRHSGTACRQRECHCCYGHRCYTSKMLDLVQESSTYTVLKCYPALKVVRELQKLLADVFPFHTAGTRHFIIRFFAKMAKFLLYAAFKKSTRQALRCTPLWTSRIPPLQTVGLSSLCVCSNGWKWPQIYLQLTGVH